LNYNLFTIDPDQELGTVYNDEEGWEFSAPITPLLKNQVFTAMIDGAFKEANTKKVPIPNYRALLLNASFEI
jgi:hypothetical protein